MSIFEMVKYHNQEYPSDIPLRLEEVAAHFDIGAVTSDRLMSLHTECGVQFLFCRKPHLAGFGNTIT